MEITPHKYCMGLKYPLYLRYFDVIMPGIIIDFVYCPYHTNVNTPAMQNNLHNPQSNYVQSSPLANQPKYSRRSQVALSILFYILINLI